MLKNTILLSIAIVSLQAYPCVSSEEFSSNNSNKLSEADFVKLVWSEKSKKLGEGSYGEVKRVPWNDESLPERMRYIAVKMSQSSEDDKFLLREVDFIDKFSKKDPIHFPNLIGCVKDTNGKIYLAIEYLNSSLETHDKNTSSSNMNPVYTLFRKLPVASRLYAYSQLAKAASVMHEEGFVHHDIKPDNIVVKSLGERPRLKLIDFGITQSKKINYKLGTNIYLDKTKLMQNYPKKFLSSEIEKLEMRSDQTLADVFALIVTIYELEKSWYTINFNSGFSPLKYLKNYNTLINHRMDLIKSTDWMNQRGLNICSSNKKVCFRDIVNSIMKSRRSEIQETSKTLYEKLLQLYEQAKEDQEALEKKKEPLQEDSSSEQPSLGRQIIMGISNFFGCRKESNVVKEAVQNEKII